MLVTLFGITTFFKLLQLLNAASPISVMPSNITTLFKASFFIKASDHISITDNPSKVLGIIRFVPT